MKKIVFGCLSVAAVAFALQFTMADAQAGIFTPCDAVGCDPCDPCGDGYGCNDDGCAPVRAGGFFLNGHMEAGFYANEYGQKSMYGPVAGVNTRGRGAFMGSGNTDLLQNTRLTGAQINQVYLSMGKAVDGRRGLDIGGTVDFTWGSDAYLTQASGMEITAKDPTGWGSGDYSASFAQAYAEIAYQRWNVAIGKFYLPFGSDSYKSTDNFFYSWSSNNLINPQVGGGAYASYKVSDKLSVIGGWVMPEEIGESGDNNAVLGGFVWTPGKRFNLRYAFAAGKDTYGPNGQYRAWGDGDRNKYFTHSLTPTTQINKRLKYVFDWSYNQSRISDDYIGLYSTTYAYGLNNEIIYQANKRWAFGTRFGILHNGTLLNDYIGDTDWYTVAVGANWTPNKWLTVKPELRYDWFDKDNAVATPFNISKSASGGSIDPKRDQISGGMSAVVKF